MRFRSYQEMVESGDWPPTNRETIRMTVGWVLGLIVGLALGWVIWGEIKCI